MSYLRRFVGTPHLGDKRVGNPASSLPRNVEIPAFSAGFWNTAVVAPPLSTVRSTQKNGSHLAKDLVIHKFGLAITTNIYN